MDRKHPPLTPEQKIRNIGETIAKQRSKVRRRELIGEVEKHHGPEIARRVRAVAVEAFEQAKNQKKEDKQ